MTKAKINFALERQDRVSGSYRRRLNDAFKALDVLQIEKLLGAKKILPGVAFIFYYLACEKIAKVMVGLYLRKPAIDADFSKLKPRCNVVIQAAETIGCNISATDTKLLFADEGKLSGYVIRNKVFHDFGPTHMNQMLSHAPNLIEAMQRFLDECRKPIIAFLNNP